MSPNLLTRLRGSFLAIFLISLIALRVCSVAEASEETLERQLLSHASQVLEKLRGQGCKTVGVLKFRVQKAGEPASDNVGTSNKFFADRLEAALAIKNPNDPRKQMQIVRDASRVAAGIPNASHLSPEGRRRLFQSQYPLAWGNRSVAVDRFVTGMVQLAADKKSFRVGIYVVGAGRSDFKVLVPPFEVATDGAILHEFGESFQLRGGSGEEETSADAAASAVQVSQDPDTHFPLRGKPAVTLRIYYDSSPVNVELRDGLAWIPEPQEGQAVTMELERHDPGERALGAVLKVNGENTIGRERLGDFYCQKWVLRPGWLKTSVPGFQFDDQHTEVFRVASPEESRGSEMDYGDDVGTISLVVFEELLRKSAAEPPVLEEPGLEVEGNDFSDEIAVAQAKFPEKPAKDAEQLKALLRPVMGRGIIKPDNKKITNPTRKEEHEWSPEPVLSAVIHYYQPAGSKP